jgi:hypothetical protein
MKQTTLPTTADTATTATLLVNLLKARRLPLCPMCAEVRSIVEMTDGKYIVCGRCLDCEEAK